MQYRIVFASDSQYIRISKKCHFEEALKALMAPKLPLFWNSFLVWLSRFDWSMFHFADPQWEKLQWNWLGIGNVFHYFSIFEILWYWYPYQDVFMCLSVCLILKCVGKQNWIYTYSKWRGLAKTYLRVDYFKIFSIPMYILILFYILSCIQTHREKIDRLVYGNTMYRTYIET